MIGNIITEQRIRLGYTQKELANATGISIATIQSIETGRRNPSWEVIKIICDFLKITIDFKY